MLRLSRYLLKMVNESWVGLSTEGERVGSRSAGSGERASLAAPA